MRYSDLHTHTTFSDGRNTMEEMVLAAIEKGLASIGFSDHSYTPFDSRYCMREEDLPRYLAQLEHLKEKYAHKIEIYKGIELDGFSELVDRSRFDYILGDCHYVETDDGLFSVDHARDEHYHTIDTYFSGDIMSYVRAYYNTYVSCTTRNRPDILGHFDLVRKFNAISVDDPQYQALASEAMVACLEITPIVELNLNPLARGQRSTPYPEDFLLPIVREHGGHFVLCSDAHRASQLAGYFDEGIARLQAHGFDSILTLQNGKFREIGIKSSYFFRKIKKILPH